MVERPITSAEELFSMVHESILDAKGHGVDPEQMERVMRNMFMWTTEGHSEATMVIPEESDVEHILDILEAEYERVEDEYVLIEEVEDERDEWVMRRGSLIMELFAQLSDQDHSRYDSDTETQ